MSSKHKKKIDAPFLSYTYPSDILKQQQQPQISMAYLENLKKSSISNAMDKSLFVNNNKNNTNNIIHNDSNVAINEGKILTNLPLGKSDCQEMRKVCCGIYQVSNQILIDYDDNTTCEISAKSATATTTTTTATMQEPLKRFEEIYYEEAKHFRPSFSSSSSVSINFKNKSNEKLNILSFGSFV